MLQLQVCLEPTVEGARGADGRLCPRLAGQVEVRPTDGHDQRSLNAGAPQPPCIAAPPGWREQLRALVEGAGAAAATEGGVKGRRLAAASAGQPMLADALPHCVHAGGGSAPWPARSWGLECALG
jgi:hypothetical protein